MVAVEEQDQQMSSSAHSVGRRFQSHGMESSVFRFKNVDFLVGPKNNRKNILSDVSGMIKWGHVLAVMGPSGAGKTTLINTLTLDATYGIPTGSVSLNGVPLTDSIFKQHCYVVQQYDKHWPYLTCRETLRYAAELYQVAAPEDLDLIVDEIIVKMGMSICADTKNGFLSGGQQRRLSIGVALLKQPTLLFLDEPTSGLDAAAASNIMHEIVRVAKEERLIIMCTIHQPSTKVYDGFDQVMIMSRGREAFSGDVADALPYFESIGFPCPPNTNPAEFYLDLVNADFSDEAAVSYILDTWQEKKPDAGSSHHRKGFLVDDDEGQTGVQRLKRAPLAKEVVIMLRRHFTIFCRDPVLYIGRCGVSLVANTIFALVYLKARSSSQEQALNKMWITTWFIAVPSNMGVVAVYAFNNEFKTIQRESKNGMVTGLSYVISKFILVLPFFFIYAIIALGIPAFVIQDTPGQAFGTMVLIFVSLIFVYESVAECLAIWFTDPIMGMLQYTNFWIASFLFAGLFIPEADMYWPFKLFYYAMPFSYFVRTSCFATFEYQTFEPCTDPATSPVCVNSTSGLEVLNEVGRIVPMLSSEDKIAFDIGILIALGTMYKLLFVVGVVYKTSRVAKILPPFSVSPTPVEKGPVPAPEETSPVPAPEESSPVPAPKSFKDTTTKTTSPAAFVDDPSDMEYSV